MIEHGLLPTPDSASLETTAYVDFMDFATRWHELLSVIIDVLDITRQDRIGFRYVNQLPVPVEATPDDLRRVVRAELVGAVGAHERTQRLVSSNCTSYVSRRTTASAPYVTASCQTKTASACMS